MRMLSRCFMLAAFVLSGLVGILAAPAVNAQDATPAADCVTTTPEENVQIVTDYVVAYDTADEAAIHETLHDLYEDNVPAHPLVPEDVTSNVDEHQLAVQLEAAFPGSTYTINEVTALDENRVLAVSTFTITEAVNQATMEVVTLPEPLSLVNVSIVTLECGMIISGITITDTLPLLLATGFVVTIPAPEATPAP